MKKQYEMFLLLSGIVTILLMLSSVASAADKVVVIPLFSSGSGDKIPTVTSKTGRVWMDRNLGAIRVAGSKSDSLSYGWLYQWGRPADGHESRTSPTTVLNDLSNGEIPGHGNFILVDEYPFDWTTPQNNTLWEGEASINNPCPPGFRVPSSKEWWEEVSTWAYIHTTGAFDSPLKLSLAGNRSGSSGVIGEEGTKLTYWCAETFSPGDGKPPVAHVLMLWEGQIEEEMVIYPTPRSNGFSVRCIKD